MTHEDLWRKCSGSWDRLRWARERRYKTAKAAADAFGVHPHTYAAYERPPGGSKHIALDHENAIRFAASLGVRWEWLLTGQGAPVDGDTRRAAMLAAYDSASPETQGAIADVVLGILRLSGVKPPPSAE